jgi:hypothetical protein
LFILLDVRNSLQCQRLVIDGHAQGVRRQPRDSRSGTPERAMTADQEDDTDYLDKREAQERALACAAADRSARHVHLDLAKRYAERRAALTMRMPGAA